MVGMHLCMGELQNVALFSKADGCEQEQKLPPCHRERSAPCCDDEALLHKADVFKTSALEIPAHQATSLAILPALILISEIIPAASVSGAWYPDYDPPLRSCDLTVAHRVFLI
jgi:hypothetical protein